MTVSTQPARRERILWLQRRILGFSRHWLAWFNLTWGLLTGLPWLAPVLMKIGAVGPARMLYTMYSFLCHQFANRSFFLFGAQLMYDYDELLATVPKANTWSGLQAFIGSPALGYKVAWSDRMVTMYGGIFLGGLLFAWLRHRIKQPPGWAWMLLLWPIIIDGATHTLSDMAGLGEGFRYHNQWLAALTGDIFPPSFYIGTTLGSFNSWARLISGLLLGFGIVWGAYPIFEAYFQKLQAILSARFE